MRIFVLLWAAISTVGVEKNVEAFYVQTTEPFSSYPEERQDVVHAEEMLEKYGYLSCVPQGSEGNVHLHRLLLRRLHQTSFSDSQTNQPLDFRLPRSAQSLAIQSKSTRNFVNARKWKDVHMDYIWKKRLQQSESASGQEWPLSLTDDHSSGNTKHVAVQDLKDGEIYYLPVCSNEDIQRAIQDFQETYQVGTEEGDLDSSTLSLLSKPRCGNPDILMAQTGQNSGSDRYQQLTGNSRRMSSFLQRKRRSLMVPERGKDENSRHDNDEDVTKLETYPLSSQLFNSMEHDKFSLNKRKPDADLPDQDFLRTKATELREATRSRHPQVEQHLEWEPHPQEAATRRRRWVADLVEKIQSGEEDARLATITPHLLAKHRNKRSTFSHLGESFNQALITWRLVNAGYSSQLEVGVQRASLALAFRMWSEVIPRNFLEDTISDTSHVDINIGFGRRSHLGCVNEFDGFGGELGHALREAGDAQIHMDDDEHFTLDSEHGTNLLKVAVHEIGHILGLGHELRNYSIMYAIYEKMLPNQGLELGWEDRKLVQKIYGSCIGPFDTVLDLLRWRPDGSLTYNTFFFRRNHFWMYENRYNRTRFGDPLYIDSGWPGLPDNIDGYAHIWTRTRDAHLFFKGEFYYVYDTTTGSVAAGYPRRIAQDFHGPPTPKNPNPKAIPSNIDTVYFDKRDENLYFFKGKKVYGYDVSKGSNGCCLPGYPKNIRKEFTPADRDSRPLPLKDLDAAYYSYTDQTVFFIKDRFFWELVSFHPNDVSRQNEVIGPFYVHDKWYDICDTTLDPYEAYIIE